MKTVFDECNVCGKLFEHCSRTGSINCPDCKENKEKCLNRRFTEDTVYLVCKWYDEYMAKYGTTQNLATYTSNCKRTIKRIANILSRSEANICKALKEGGKL